MKKQLLLAVAAGFLAVAAHGQIVLKNTRPVKVEKSEIVNRYAPVLSEVPSNRSAIVKALPAHRNAPNPHVLTITKYDIATSNNIYGALLSESTHGSYLNSVDVLSYTARKSIGVATATGNSGYLQTHVSYNKGMFWDTLLVVTNNAAPVNRYPSGVLLNPPGNTIANQSYAVVGAPMLDGSLWDGATLASIRLDSANGSILNLPNASATQIQWMPRLGMFAGTNGNAYIAASNYDYNSTATVIPFDGAVINRGVWNATNNNLDWTVSQIVPNLAIDAADGSQLFSNFGTIAFSADGVTGYYALLGRDAANDHLSPMPIIYRTTDAGLSWNLYNTSDFTSLFTSILPNNTAGFMRPFFTAHNGYGMSVDAWGKLHIVCEVAIAASNHPDSLNYLNYLGTLFDTYETQGGTWNTILLGQILSEPVVDIAATTGTPNQLGYAVGWDGRLQITRSSDGYKMGYVWMDTDLSISVGNDYPNLFGVAADFQNNIMTDIDSFTTGGAYDANNYWMYTAGDGYYDGTNNFVVPTYTSRSLNGGLDTDPWMHEYVGGIQFAAADFVNPITVGLNQISAEVKAAVVYPNPARGNALVTADINTSSNVTITLSNQLGQVVKTFNVGDMNAGKVSYNMDLNDIKAGFYIVTINAGNGKAVTKLNVQ